VLAVRVFFFFKMRLLTEAEFVLSIEEADLPSNFPMSLISIMFPDFFPIFISEQSPSILSISSA